ncbi:cupin domain-containing protein [Nocardia sp. NPDC050378]|uniref:cupin domain-containing protein n=1 Tax=Nocardia sp. NPDC050378 TaxID=3155400 RepID=UPI00340907CC
MTFPDPQNWNLVVATVNDSGEPDFVIGAKPEAILNQPGIVEGVWYWSVENGHSKETPGSMPKTLDLAGPNGSTFGLVRFAANSAGKVDVASTGIDAESSDDHDAGMHASNTIDYEVVLSGKLDLELPGGKVHTLVPGDLLVKAGVPHAWKNRYDEDCVFLSITIGYNT